VTGRYGTERAQPPLSRALVVLMAVATGLAVANNYYAQPLLPQIARTLHLAGPVAGLVVTVAQGGYALGLMFVLPLGDLLERRRLLVVMGVGTSGALVWLGTAPSGAVLLPAAVAVGALSVQAQLLVPFAATLAAPAERGRVVGQVMSGLLLGILLARTVAGYLAEAGTWRTVYWVAAGAMLIQAAVLAVRLPSLRPAQPLRYPRLIASVPRLLVDEPVLRLRAVYGGLSFGSFSVLWTSLAFLLAGRPYHFSTGTIGLFGLAGAAGALTATVAGRLADRGGARLSTGFGSALLALSWLPIWLGRHSLAALVVGIVLLDVAAQGLHITNQSEIYRLDPAARNRINSAYMTCYFAGGAAGSASSAAAWAAGGWPLVSLLGAIFGVAAVVLFAWRRR
jgi:predicted MFS family arabinose efflux permease